MNLHTSVSIVALTLSSLLALGGCALSDGDPSESWSEQSLTLRARWSRSFVGRQESSQRFGWSDVIADARGRVIAGVDTSAHTRSVMVFDGATGAELATVASMTDDASSIAVRGDTLYVCARATATRQGSIAAFDLTPATSAPLPVVEQWRVPLPVVGACHVLLDGLVVAPVRTASGDQLSVLEPDGSVRFTAPYVVAGLQPYGLARVSRPEGEVVAEATGPIYVRASRMGQAGGPRVVALDRSSGALLWQAADGELLAAANGGAIVAREANVSSWTSWTTALSLETGGGASAWTTTLADGFFVATRLANGDLFLVGKKGHATVDVSTGATRSSTSAPWGSTLREQQSGGPRSIAVGPSGEVHVLGQTSTHGWSLRSFDAGGVLDGERRTSAEQDRLAAGKNGWFYFPLRGGLVGVRDEP